tara:strand:+ start:146 stop:1012 length:867 start_codon:yes stop_codon:yes gene_type:complete
MTLKNQWDTIKKNWIIVLVLALIVLIPIFSGNSASLSKSSGYGLQMMESAEMAVLDSGRYYGNNDFAPEIETRKITKTSSLTTEVERGTFHNTEAKIKAIVEGTDAILLNENSNKYGKTKNSYYSGSYQIKVPTSKYSLALDQLKALGEVQSFSENARDITASYTNTQTELEVERQRLQRYEDMYSKAITVSDQIELSDRIFNQERTIKYLEQSLENKDLRIEYTTISLNVQEERSSYANIALVKFSDLIRKLVDSFNSLIALMFWILPWAAIALIVWFGVRFVKRRN